ncbi:hypothetical protein KAR91_78705 [Candidatus Pacearchaeota archaeon]|nr:hypothetical protein [Candidatus Pacearchaeota archaeon]
MVQTKHIKTVYNHGVGRVKQLGQSDTTPQTKVNWHTIAADGKQGSLTPTNPTSPTTANVWASDFTLDITCRI